MTEFDPMAVIGRITMPHCSSIIACYPLAGLGQRAGANAQVDSEYFRPTQGNPPPVMAG